jgi:tetratricopeptide (TPR) repeat protein
MTERFAQRLGVPVDQLVEEDRSVAVEQARIEINFARLALANATPSEAVRSLESLDLSGLDLGTASDATLVMAESLQETGQLEQAAGVLEILTERCRREGASVLLAQAATVLAVMYLESGDISRSADTAQAALAEIEAAGLEGTDEHLRLGSVLVSALSERGDLLHASRTIMGLITVAERVGSARAKGAVYWNAAGIAHERGRVADTLRLTDRAVALLSEAGDSRDLPRLRLNYAFVLVTAKQPRPAEALRQLDLAEADPALAGSRLDLGTAATFRGRAHLQLGEVDNAAEHAARALQLLGPSDHIERIPALILLGDVGVAQRDLDLSSEAYREARRELSGLAPSRRVAHLWRELGDALRESEDLTWAVDAYDRGLRMIGVAPRPHPGQALAPPDWDAYASTG